MRHVSIFIALFISGTLMAQAPNAFNYQAVVRDASGEEVASQNVSFKISILEGSETGSPVYVETHNVTTNEFGLANFAIGNGSVESGTLSPDGWSDNAHYLKVELDPEGGTAYTHLGTSPLLAVPYAFHAETVSQDAVDDADADPTNELQSLSLNGSDLSLSDGGGTVTLPSGGSNLWMENGSSLYTENSVGIGTDSPTQDLDVVDNASSLLLKSTGTGFGFEGDAFIMLDKSLESKNANLNLQTDGSTQFYAGLLGNNDYRISTDISSLNGLEVQQDGDVAVSGEVQTQATGDANMVPIAYGTVTSGSLQTSSGNVTFTKNSTGEYQISIDGESYFYTDYTVSLTMLGRVGFIEGGSVSGNLLVFTYDQSGNAADSNFTFVIYKP